jgi:uncharacterized protein with PQ loop repeat
MPTSAFGWVGGGLSLLYNVPQMYHIWKRKTAKDLSMVSLAVRLLSYALYLTHGFLIGDEPLLYMTMGSMIQVTMIVCQKCYYARNTETEPSNTTSPSENHTLENIAGDASSPLSRDQANHPPQGMSIHFGVQR